MREKRILKKGLTSKKSCCRIQAGGGSKRGGVRVSEANEERKRNTQRANEVSEAAKQLRV